MDGVAIMDIYRCMNIIMNGLIIFMVNIMYYGHICNTGFQVEDQIQQVFKGQKVEVWPRVTWKLK